MMPLWLELVFLLGFPIALILTVVAWVIDHVFLTPQEAKLIKKAARKKKPVVFLGSDDGYADLEMLAFTGKGGYAATSKEPKKRWTGFFARSVDEEQSEETKTEQKDKETRIAAFINKLASRKLFLRHAKIPIWFGYSGKAILTSLYALIGDESLKDMKLNPVVNLTEIKSLFSKPWDTGQQRANEIDAKTEGLLEGKKFFGVEGWKPLVVPVGIILALVICIIILSVLFLK